MSIVFAAGAAALGLAAATGHSWLGEHKIFRPLYAGTPGGILASRATRDVIRAVFHIPSLTWAVLGLAVLAARFEGGSAPLSVAAALVFAGSGIGNLAALRRPHFGGLILLAAAGLTLIDWGAHP